MKITQLDIEGFRSLKKVSWKPGDLNVVIGPNGSGKSNLLRMLDLISATSQKRLSKFVQGAGGMGPLVWDGRADQIDFHLWTSPANIPFSSEQISYELSLVRAHQMGSYSPTTYSLEGELLGPPFVVSSQTSSSDPHYYLANIFTDRSVFNETTKSVQPLNEQSSEETFTETLLSRAAGPLSSNSLVYVFQKDLSAWKIYQELRVDQNAEIRRDAVARYETTISADGQNLINVLHTLYTGDRDFKQQINDAMHAAFGEDFDEIIFPPTSDQRVQLRIRWKTLQREQSAADLSDGTLRFLFLLAVLASPTPAPLIAIDEPETGLHPSMLPIIAALAVDAAERTQVVFTTHSDQFLDAFQDTRPTTTVARWENGETTLTTLSDEDLAYWLKDYSLGRMYRSGELEALA